MPSQQQRYDPGRIQKSVTEIMQSLEKTFAGLGVDQWTTKPMRPTATDHYFSAEKEKRRVTVEFELDGRYMSLTMADHPQQRQNLYVIWAALEAMRMNRVRGLEKVLTEAYKLLSGPSNPEDPYALLNVTRGTTAENLNAQYRSLAFQYRNDEERLRQLNVARQAILDDLGLS